MKIPRIIKKISGGLYYIGCVVIGGVVLVVVVVCCFLGIITLGSAIVASPYAGLALLGAIVVLAIGILIGHCTKLVAGY